MQEAVPEVVAAKAAETQQHFARLQLPARALSSLSCGCASERQLFSWLEQYDLQPYQAADQQRLAGMLFGLIDEIARWCAPAGRRLAMLDLLREYTLACVDAMAIQRAPLATVQTAELRKTVLVAVRLLEQLGSAYAGVAAQLEGEGGFALLLRQRCARSLQRALDSYRQIIRVTALFGLAAPQQCWRNMQILLRLAQLRQLAARKVGDPLHPRGSCSVSGAYLQVALFASANPGQLGAAEQEQLWGLTHDWSRAATLVTRYRDRHNGLLASLALDQPPVPANRLGSCRVDLRHFSEPLGWKVDLNGVLALLARQLQRRRDPLLEKIQLGWAAPGGRSERRAPLQKTCEIVTGMGAICHLLGGGKPSAHGGKTQSVANCFFDWERPGRDHLCLEVDSVDFLSGEALGEYEVVLPRAPSLRSEARARARTVGGTAEHYRPQQANVLNCSGHGVGLSLSLSGGARLRTGELVAIRLRDQWQVAVVRWQYTLPDHCRVGVEVLATESRPVEVRRRTAAGHFSAPIAGLLVGEPGDRPQLILPAPLFKCCDNVEMQGHSQPQPLTLQKQTLATGSFARFEFV